MPQIGTLPKGLAASFTAPEVDTRQLAPAELMNRLRQSTTNTDGGLASLFSNVQAVAPTAPQNKPLTTANLEYDPDSYKSTLKGIESSGGDYTARNKRTGAMGAYQMLPSTLKALQKRTGDTFSNEDFIKNPKLQDKYFDLLVEDNVQTLKRKGMPINNFTLWATHNLGPKQAQELLGDGELSKKTTKFIESNLPGQEPTRENYIKTYGPKFGYIR